MYFSLHFVLCMKSAIPIKKLIVGFILMQEIRLKKNQYFPGLKCYACSKKDYLSYVKAQQKLRY